MYGLKKLALPLLMGALALALVIPAAAQDATATPDASGSTGSTDTTMSQGTANCDSTTILLAGLAQRYFGYTPTDVTLSNYVYGQYSPLFDTSTMMAPSMEATADMSGAAANPTLAPATILLIAPVVTGEDPACTQLRNSLESYFSNQMQSSNWDANFRNHMSGMGATG
ncbi:MAG: hypothetical protein GC179_09790 [Anaerolineaceae bacterium]|nr:hypothetical protein [Anaerolineaceae bacterium]